MTVCMPAGYVRRVRQAATVSSQSSVPRERMGNHRKPVFLRVKRTSKHRSRK